MCAMRENVPDNSAALVKNEAFFRTVLLIAISIPPILSFLFVRFFGVNVVYADEWSFVPLVEKSYLGALTAADFLKSDNEHIFLFPKIVIVSLARLTNYNTVAEMYFSLAVACVAFLLLFRMYLKDFGASANALLKFLPVSWLFFTLRQEENLLMGLQMNVHLGMAGFVAAVFALEKGKGRWLPLALAAGIVSTFSNANGLLVWPVGGVFLALSGVKKNAASLVAWLSAAALALFIYFSNISLPHDTGVHFTLRDASAALAFFILNIGSPLAFVKSSAIGMGAAVGLFALAVCILSFRNRRPENNKWIALLIFSLGTSVFFTVGRVHFGFWAALASRYVTMTLLGIIGIYVAILNCYERAEDRARPKHALLYGAVLSVLFVGIVSGYAGGVARGREVQKERKEMRVTLLNYRTSSDEELERMLNNPEKIRRNAAVLEKYRLNVFR